MNTQFIEILRKDLRRRLHLLRVENLKIERDFKNNPKFANKKIERIFNSNSDQIESIKETLKDLEPIR